jgi:uncharacterized protein (DUF433 family)
MAIGVEALIARLGSGIESTPGACGGEPRIAGTRIPIWTLEQARRLGASEADLLRDHPELRAADLVNAWTYVATHHDEIDGRIRANEGETTVSSPPTGAVTVGSTPGGRPFAGYERETAAYERLEPELLRTARGRFVAFVGDEMVGPVATFGEALRAGYRRFGRGPLFVKQVLADDPVVAVSRDVTPCRT